MAAEPMMSLSQYRKHFLTEESCYRYLYRMKWPEGYRCSRCSHDSCYTITTRNHPLYECKHCGNQTSLTVGTIFEKSHIDMTIWFAAIYSAVQDRQVSTALISNELDINYQTAWYMMKKIRGALANPCCVAHAPSLDE
ncbi:transposase [Cohnella sp. LGH]|uniref:transposase n=1 Tax=Cohnella sp. LGH TaxID=1619153 RepID=UPI001AD9E23C|nr:transposase [Cohnella sp. LGH]QTH44560.1 transposase [Cohnella sp. LGH]